MENNMFTIDKVTTQLHQALALPVDYQELYNEAYDYCSKDNTTYRIYYLGLFLLDETNSSTETLGKFYSYFTSISDYTNIWSDFSKELLMNKDYGIINNCEGNTEVSDIIQELYGLYDRYGVSIPVDKTKDIENRARSAAWSAGSAGSAAWSVARSAAESAAESAESAARSAAWSVESAAESTWSAAAAGSARYKDLLHCYMGILEERSND